MNSPFYAAFFKRLALLDRQGATPRDLSIDRQTDTPSLRICS
jgi:hypothetical protein